METERQPVTTVVLDVGGVLFHNAVGAKIRDMAIRYRLDPRALGAFRTRRRREVDLGSIGERQFWREMLLEAGVDPVDEDLQMDAYLTEIPGAFDALLRLRDRYELAILSNDSMELSLARRSRLPFAIPDAVISAEVGSMKPDPAIFRTLLDRVGKAPASCMFIDDAEPNVRAALAAGLQAFTFRGWQDALQRLAADDPIRRT